MERRGLGPHGDQPFKGSGGMAAGVQMRRKEDVSREPSGTVVATVQQKPENDCEEASHEEVGATMQDMLYKIADLWIDFKEAASRILFPPPKLSEEEQRECDETIAAFSANAAKNHGYTPDQWHERFVTPLFEARGEAAAKAWANATKKRTRPKVHTL